MPGYGQCKCGKVWNRYVIGTGPDTRTASPEIFIAREIPVRDGVIVANKRTAAALDSPDYVQREFEDWLMTQGTSMEAERRNPRELQNKLDEFLAQRGGKDPADEIMQYLSFFKGAPFAGYEDFDACTRENSDKDRPDAYCGEIKHRTEDKTSAYTGYDDEAPEPFREQREVQRSRRRADPRKGLGWEHRGMDDDQLGNTTFGRLPEKAAAGGYLVQPPRWKGKTPAGPQGSGVEGLKQKTRYKGVSTPYLRELHKRVMTNPNSTSMFDVNELLRELSFREVLGALHDLSSPGGTPDSDGTRTKRTDPDMTAADDWHHRDKGGRWTRGDGHALAAIA